MSETTEINTKTILKAIQDLSDKLDKNQEKNDAQFEAIRQGLVQNNSAFNLLESAVYSVRSNV